MRSDCDGARLVGPLSHQLLFWLLNLVQSCLDFDFIGTYNDENGEDMRSVQVPSCA